MPRDKEATIVINGVLLTNAQSMAVRMAVEGMRSRLADTESGYREALGPLGDSWAERLTEVSRAIHRA